MITIKIDNPEIEAKYSKEEIEKKVSDFFLKIKPKRRLKKEEKVILYSLNFEDAPKKVQEAFKNNDNKEEYVSFKTLK